LAQLTLPPDCQAEILIIDNNSRDDTRIVAERFAQKMSWKVRYCFEPKQGLSAARNCAVKEAAGEYLAFLDDECVVPDTWLDAAVRDIRETGAQIIGGPYLGRLLPGQAPKWFKASYGDAYFLDRKYPRGFQDGFRANGGNMFIHRRVFEECLFDENLGIQGDRLKLGEEYALQEIFLSRNPGLEIFYEPEITVEHFVLPHKMQLRYHAIRTMEGGASSYRRKEVRLLSGLAKATLLLMLAPVRIMVRNRDAYPYWQNFVYERVIPGTMPALGAAMEHLRRRYPAG
jgi:glycosyltransferase involved in cell wall biosynthesis